MNAKRTIFAISAVLLMLSACDTGARYVTSGDCVLYSYWTFSFGRRYDTVPGADPATFHSKNDWMGVDKEHVYYQDCLVAGADPATAKPLHEPLIMDKRDIYYKATPLGVASVKDFKVLKWYDDDFYATDGHYAYFDTLRLIADVATFKARREYVATDSKQVFFIGKLIQGADPATYKPFFKGCYCRDKNHIWYYDELVEGVDIATFTVDDDFNHAHDKYGAFVGAKRVVEGAEEDTDKPEEPIEGEPIE